MNGEVKGEVGTRSMRVLCTRETNPLYGQSCLFCDDQEELVLSLT